MGSLVALSLTVEEKEEWVLSSNRKDSAGFTVSKQGGQIKDTKGDKRTSARHIATTKKGLFTFRLTSVFE